MSILMETEFRTKSGLNGRVITRRRVDGMFVTTFEPRLGLDFHTVDVDKSSCHETVKNFLRDVKGCSIKGDEAFAMAGAEAGEE